MRRLAWICLLIWLIVTPGLSQVEQGGMPADTIAAWERSGATFGWIWMDPEGKWRFDLEKPESPGPCAELLRCFEPVESLPSFRFANVAPGDFLRLPHPAVPFGLKLGLDHTNGFGMANDAVLAELAKAGFSNLQALTLGGQYNTAITDAGINAMATLHSLRWLDSGDTSATASGLQALAKLTDLETLTVQDDFHRGVDGSVINALATLPRLRALAIRPLPELAGLTQLQALRIGWVNASTLKAVANLKQLRALTIEVGDFNRGIDAGLNELAGLLELRSLRLQTNAVSEAGMKTLSGLPKLERLDLKRTSVTSAGLRQLAGSSRLKALYLSRMTDADFAELVSFSQLEELHIGANGVTDAGIKSVAAISGLKSLELSNLAVTDIGLKELSALSRLQAVSLNGERISDVGLEQVAALQQLQWLRLTDPTTAITDAGTRQLAGLSHLQMLSLHGAKISGEGLGNLSRNLRELDLSLTHVSDAELAAIAAGLPQLRSLHLDDTNISDGGLQSLARMPRLRSITLNRTRVTNAGLGTLKALSQLEDLSLSGTKITDVADLMGMTRLHSLQLPIYFFANPGRAEMEKLQRALPHTEIRAQAPN